MAFHETVCVAVTSADIPSLLNIMQEFGILTGAVRRVEDLKVSLEISANQLAQLETICKRRGDVLQIIEHGGFVLTVKRLLHRPVLVVGFLLLIVLTLLLPTRVLFIRVEGNSRLPTSQILEKAASCGVFFGASRRDVRSEKVKNALLEAIPELQWMGINTKGCVATITVRERQIIDSIEKNNTVSSIVALRDGIIQEVTVTKGSAACKVGQAVKEGQVLISGYTDCGLTIQACRAEGEIFGLTRHELEVTVSSDRLLRGQITAKQEKYALILGKKRINFYKGSGISDNRCVKMYSEKYVTLPGGFVLPIGIVTEITIDTECASGTIPVADEDLSAFAGKYLQSTMRSGRILSCRETILAGESCITMTGTYQCIEMIGVRKQEEIIKPNE